MTRSNRWILAIVAVVLVLAAGTVVVGRWAQGVSSSAARGRSQAMSGAKSLAALDTTAAISQFDEANQSFSSVAQAIGPEWVARTVEPIPWIGRQYAASLSLVSIGLDGSRAGLELAKALRATPDTTAAANPESQIGASLAPRLEHAKSAVASLSEAASRADRLSETGLAPPLARAVRSLRTALGETAPLLARSRALLQLGSYLLSGNHRIIVVSQDGAELRPTGGWAGSFGIVNSGSAGVRLESYQDVFVLPSPRVRVIPPPGALQTKNFNFRNANWWIDFPTSAQTMLGFWREANQPPVDGIVVVDTVVMANLLDVVGPVTVPRFKETFTSENLLGRLLYLTQVERGGQPDRKNVLVELATELEKRMLKASPADLAKSARVLEGAANAKHVQMYFTDPVAQAAVEDLGWSGRVAPPPGTTDVVVISNAMNKPGKVNIAMKKTIDYHVGLQPDRSAETTLVLGYANTGVYLESLPPDFRDWLRVYRTPDTVFPNTNPSGSKTTTLTEFGFPAEARGFTVPRGQKHEETLTARVPRALRTDWIQNPLGGGRYKLYMVRQADLEDIPTNVIVTAPPGWIVTSAGARLTASGASLPVTWERDLVRMAVPLSGDLVLEVRLARQER